MPPTVNTTAPDNGSPVAAFRTKPERRPLLTAGIAAAAWTVTLTIADGATRPDYDPSRHWVSHLALGERGWLGVVNLVIAGGLLLCFAVGLRHVLSPGRAATRARRMVLLAGLGLVAAATFPIDPGLGYPPGRQETHSLSGSLHDAAGLVVFASLTAAAALLGRAVRATFRAAPTLGYLVASTVAGSFVACSILVALDYAGTLPDAPSGLLERVALFVGLGWLATVAIHLRSKAAR